MKDEIISKFKQKTLIKLGRYAVIELDFRKKMILVFLSLLLIFGPAIYMREMVKGLPSIYDLEEYTPSLITKVYDRHGELVAELFSERRMLIPLRSIPVDLQNAILAIEDHNFFSHWGVSFRGILRAFKNNIIRRRVAQGGSTITQQLAKVIFLTPERTIKRKVRELLLTIQLEHNFTKEEILQLYLNQIYFGSGAYGVEAASRMYFGKHVHELNLAESAMVAGLPRAPNYYSPFRNGERALKRRAVVLRRMRTLGFITEEEEEEANAYPLNTERVPYIAPVAPYFVEYIRILLEPIYGSQMIYRGGLSIYTTLDRKAQESAEEVLGKYLTKFDSDKIKEFEIDKSTPVQVQGALICIDPKTGGIRALVGGRDFRESQFNRAVQAKRQPGSVFKPIIYTAAIKNGFTPATKINDSPLIYINDGNRWRLSSRSTDYLEQLPEEWLEDPMKVWNPANYKNRYNGEVLLRRALERSMNMCSIQVIDAIGPMRAIEYARKLGITSPLTNTLSLALGSSEVTLIEITSAYSVFASGGIKTEPYAIIRIEDPDGRVLEEHLPKEQEALSPQTCYIMTNLLRGVVENGTGGAARWLRRPAAGKTGTTNNYTDAWFIGFTPQLVAGVWVGYDDQNLTLGEKKSGGAVAAPIWTDFMYKTLRGKPVMDFNPPSNGIVFTLIDPKTGLLALSKTPGAYLEAFLKGTEPKLYYMQKIVEEEREDDGSELIKIDGNKMAGEVEEEFYKPKIPKDLLEKSNTSLIPGATEESKPRISIEFLPKE